MDFDESPEDLAFRAEVCEWLARQEVVGQVRNFNGLTPDDDLDWVAVAKVWQQFLADEGWACITWPVEHGGRGGTATQAAIFAEEAARVGAFGATFAVGISMAGPTIIAHGTEEQKRRYLRPTLRGDEIWCQLFSEPGAGSDLAGLSTRAVRDGEEWVVDGQKVWTSGAHFSDWGILLTRTDPDQPKHRGITYFLLDMRTPGIEIRPLRQITGTAHFNEVFLTGVRIPHANVLGEVNGGWSVAMTTLANERTFMGGHTRALGYRDLFALAHANDVADDPIVRQGLAASFTRAELARYLNLRTRTMSARGLPPGPEVSVAKLAAAWNLKRNAELALSIEGAAGMLMDGDAPSGGAWQLSFLGAPAIRIAGGSDEIQRNVIGERVLGLPVEPRVDKGIPFRELASLASAQP
jgi:alkylation response protein AidB-like acyl-CoA dehydrogenase